MLRSLWSHSRPGRSVGRRRRPIHVLRFEPLESRLLLSVDPQGPPITEGSSVAAAQLAAPPLALLSGPATFTVNSDGDASDDKLADGICETATAGECTLRAALEEANAFANFDPTTPDSILFDIPGAGPHTIQPASALPDVTDRVIVDGTSQPLYAGTPLIELDGHKADAGDDGLRVTAGGTTIRGLAINRFGGDGIELVSQGGNKVEGNYIGTDPLGTLDLGNGAYGVRVSGLSGNTIGGPTSAERNVISGNGLTGVLLFGAGAHGNLVEGNYIGTTAGGAAQLPNDNFGVHVVDGANTSLINNTISGNAKSGVVIQGVTASGTLVEGNQIGTNALGAAAVPNGGIGLLVIDAPGTTIGGDVNGQENIVSGNDRSGIVIQGASASGTTIEGNHIGLAANGSTDLGNGSYGVWLLDSPSATVGGMTAAEANFISGNDRNGLVISGATATGNAIEGNLIGTNSTGLLGRGNTNIGVWILDAPGNTLEGNTIAASGKHGVLISGAGASGNALRGNLIGTAANGTSALGNSGFGVWILEGSGNTLGGTGAGEGNVIAASGLSGVAITGASASGNLLEGNAIGTDAGATLDLGNAQRGVQLLVGAHDNTIGGTAAGAGNTIAHNGAAGVWVVENPGTVNNAIRRNSIFDNGGPGIDLGPTGATANDPDDTDEGANNRQNAPVIAVDATLDGTDLQLSYLVDSEPVTGSAFDLTVEFFKADGAGQEGRTFLGSDLYTQANYLAGNKAITLSAIVGLSPGDQVVATATDADGNTSEFSLSVMVVDPPALLSLLESAGDDEEEPFMAALDELFATLANS